VSVSSVIRPCCVVLMSVGLMATGSVADDPKASRLLAQARQALGGEAKLATVQGLTAIGGATRPRLERLMNSELRIDLQFPGRLLRTDANRPPGSDATFVMLRGLDGGTLLRKSKIINGGPGHRMSQPPLVGGSEATALISARHELTRFAIALLLTPPPDATAQFADGGEAESPDGKADVLVVTGANGFAARVFLDKSSHRPLMMTYRDFDPRFIVPPRPGDPPGAARSPEKTPVELTWFFDDYKSVSGIQLPHRISRAIDGEPDEEWTFTRVVLNPAFAADAFTDK
jgi:hypothetical protein